MKEPVVLYTLDRLEYSQEILLYKEPKELSLTIWVIVLLFVTACKHLYRNGILKK